MCLRNEPCHEKTCLCFALYHYACSSFHNCILAWICIISLILLGNISICSQFCSSQRLWCRNIWQKMTRLTPLRVWQRFLGPVCHTKIPVEFARNYLLYKTKINSISFHDNQCSCLTGGRCFTMIIFLVSRFNCKCRRTKFSEKYIYSQFSSCKSPPRRLRCIGRKKSWK